MTDGIGRIFGGNNYGVGGYVPQRKEENPETQTGTPVVNHEETQVDPSKVMEFLAHNNYFVAPTKTAPVTEVDPATIERIGGYMERFEMIYSVVEKEFGEKNAPLIMNIMDPFIS